MSSDFLKILLQNKFEKVWFHDSNDNNEGKIILSTVHSAKGLEWDVVLIIDLVEDRFPSRHAMTRPEDYGEERALMYVAMTRAKKILYNGKSKRWEIHL